MTGAAAAACQLEAIIGRPAAGVNASASSAPTGPQNGTGDAGREAFGGGMGGGGGGNGVWRLCDSGGGGGGGMPTADAAEAKCTLLNDGVVVACAAFHPSGLCVWLCVCMGAGCRCRGCGGVSSAAWTATGDQGKWMREKRLRKEAARVCGRAGTMRVRDRCGSAIDAVSRFEEA